MSAKSSSEPQRLDYSALKDYGQYGYNVSEVSLRLIGGVIGMGAVIFILMAESELSNLPFLAVVAFAFLAVGIAMLAHFQSTRAAKRAAMVVRFAADNGFRVGDVNPYDMPGSMFAIGRRGASKTAVIGMLRSFPFELFQYVYVVGSDKYERTFTVTVMEVTLPHMFPQLVLDSLLEPGQGIGAPSTLPITYKPSQRLALEGDFSRYYDLYVPEGHAEDALVILTPDVMQTLLEAGTGCDMEIIKDKLYFYWPGEPDSSRSFKEKFEAAQIVLAAMERQLLSRAAAITNSAERVWVAPDAQAKGTLQKQRWSVSNIGLLASLFAAYMIGGFVVEMVSPAYAVRFNRWAPLIFILLGMIIASFPYFVRDSKQQRHRSAWGRNGQQTSDDDWIRP